MNILATLMVSKLCCMICGEEKCDQPTRAPEQDEAGDWWTYCRDCDCWTCHPKESYP